MYLPNNIYTYVMNTIFSAEIIETLPFIRNRIINAEGQIQRSKIILLRIVIWLITILIAFTTKDVINVLNVSGSLFTPIVSYFGPVSYTDNASDDHLLFVLQKPRISRSYIKKASR